MPHESRNCRVKTIGLEATPIIREGFRTYLFGANFIFNYFFRIYCKKTLVITAKIFNFGKQIEH